MNEIVKLLSKSEQNMRNAKIITDTFEKCRPKMTIKFFDAFHEKFNGTLDRVETAWDYDKWNGTSADITYMLERGVKPGISVVFILSANKDDGHCLLAGFAMMRDGEDVRCGDKEEVKDIRRHYGINEMNSNDEWFISYEFITFESELINLINFNGNHENYFKLFNPDKFDEIVNSTVKQAQTIIAKFKK